MDFIERWFNVSPDGGSGILEAVWLSVIVVVAIALLTLRRVQIRRRRDDHL
jgi:hypothetical protein